ncbi:hypothetical protein [Nocardioides sp. MH1]|uniref:hypothetical protein n=1 Tax=Nocardioides sp. MH1 TaxID=3242490 RepID=UPI003520D6BA
MTHLILATVTATDGTPSDNSVVAGPIGFVVFIALLVAVALLGWSLSKHLKKVHAAADQGVYGAVESDDREAGGKEAGGRA